MKKLDSWAKDLAEVAKARVRGKHGMLENADRTSLADDESRRQQADAAIVTIRALRVRVATGGRTFTRDEMNERGISCSGRTRL